MIYNILIQSLQIRKRFDVFILHCIQKTDILRSPHTPAHSCENHAMSQKAKDFNAFFDFQKRAIAPFAEMNEWAVRTFERAARQSYEAAGEAVEFGIAQARATVGAKDLQQLASKQTELASEFVGRQTARSNEWLKFASTSQAEVGKWVASANEEILSAVRKSA